MKKRRQKMTIQRKYATERVVYAGRDERRVNDQSRAVSPFGGVFNALKPLIS
jgi:hypothetical protein